MSRIKQQIRNLKEGVFAPIYTFAHKLYDLLRMVEFRTVYCIFRPFPLKNKIVATAFSGKKYGDNTKFIVEELHKLNPNIDIVWFKAPDYEYDMPGYIRCVECSSDCHVFRRAYEYVTAKVWLDTHLLDKQVVKRPGQFVVNTWHGGLGIKRIEGDVPKFASNPFQMEKLQKNADKVDLFISNSDFLSEIYRRAFFYKGEIMKCGLPKSDILLSDAAIYRKKVRSYFSLPEDQAILLYAPTYRSSCEDDGVFDPFPYQIDFERVCAAAKKRWKKEWTVLVRWHPSMTKVVGQGNFQYGEHIIDATDFLDMQELVLGSDMLITDYSSCIFDAALIKKPAFIFATDFVKYRSDRGTYFELEELPFPYAKNNEELIENILAFNMGEYSNKIQNFSKNMGLYESGRAAKEIAQRLQEYVLK